MSPTAEVDQSLLASWRTSNRVTAFLVEHLPDQVWNAPVPGDLRRTVRTIAAHLHNCRCRWLRTLGLEHGIKTPALVDLRRVSRRQLLSALGRSSRAMEQLFELGLANGGRVPPSRLYVWRNLPLDIGHVLTYFVAHEGHHRGQIVMLARQLGHRLPAEVTNGLWWWTGRAKETGGMRGWSDG